jgi:hypothetical protein
MLYSWELFFSCLEGVSRHVRIFYGVPQTHHALVAAAHDGEFVARQRYQLSLGSETKWMCSIIHTALTHTLIHSCTLTHIHARTSFMFLLVIIMGCVPLLRSQILVMPSAPNRVRVRESEILSDYTTSRTKILCTMQ